MTAQMEITGRTKIGLALVRGGWITEEPWAEEVSARTGGPVEGVLITSGAVSRLDLYRVLADLWHCGYVDLTTVRQTAPPATGSGSGPGGSRATCRR
jgi:hypothetical protein